MGRIRVPVVAECNPVADPLAQMPGTGLPLQRAVDQLARQLVAVDREAAAAASLSPVRCDSRPGSATPSAVLIAGPKPPLAKTFLPTASACLNGQSRTEASLKIDANGDGVVSRPGYRTADRALTRSEVEAAASRR